MLTEMANIVLEIDDRRQRRLPLDSAALSHVLNNFSFVVNDATPDWTITENTETPEEKAARIATGGQALQPKQKPSTAEREL